MTQTHSSTLKISLPFQVDSEEELVTHLVQSASHAGICSDPVAVTNLYVSLKSKPLAILAGPEQTGKIAMIQCLARFLVEDDSGDPDGRVQYQVMEGHPWSAAKSGNVAFFTEIHTRYTSEKLFCMMEEAWRPENINKIFLACLTRISPAELEGFFSELAFMMRHGSIMRFGDVHFSDPIPFPTNLILIGTMDTASFDWWDIDLLSSTTVIQWPEKLIHDQFNPISVESIHSGEKAFLSSYLRSEQAVYRKLYTLLGWQRQPVLPLFLIESLFEKEGNPLPRTLVNEAMVYLANSWSEHGHGLFHPLPEENLAIALDLAITQTYLPRAGRWIRRSRSLQENLGKLLNGKYPRSALTLENMAG